LQEKLTEIAVGNSCSLWCWRFSKPSATHSKFNTS